MPMALPRPGDMQVDERRLAARLAVEIRGADRHALVQVHDVLDLRVVEQRIEQRALGGAGIAEDAVDAVGCQRLHEYLPTAHGIFSWLCPAMEPGRG